MKFPAINRSTAILTGSAIADRGFLGIAALLATVLLGRWAGPEELGVFALFAPIVFVAIALQESLITAPYTVYAMSCTPPERRVYLGSVLLHTAALSGIIAIALATASAVAHFAGLQPYVAVTAILAPVVPCVLLREFARRVVYVEFRPALAALISVGVGASQLLIMAALHGAGGLTAVTTFVAMGVSSVLGGVAWLLCNRHVIQFQAAATRVALARNWFLGRWVTIAQVSEVLRIHIFPWLLALAVDERGVGVFAACAAVAGLSGPFQIAISNLLVAQFAAADHKGGVAATDCLVWRATTWITAAMSTFTLALILVSGELVPWIYGAEYVGTQLPLVLLLVAHLVTALALPAARALFVLGRSDLDFACHAIGTVVTIVAGVPFVFWWGISGAAVASLLGSAIKAVVNLLLYHREVRRRSTAKLPGGMVTQSAAAIRRSTAARCAASLAAVGQFDAWTEETR